MRWETQCCWGTFSEDAPMGWKTRACSDTQLRRKFWMEFSYLSSEFRFLQVGLGWLCSWLWSWILSLFKAGGISFSTGRFSIAEVGTTSWVCREELWGGACKFEAKKGIESKGSYGGTKGKSSSTKTVALSSSIEFWLVRVKFPNDGPIGLRLERGGIIGEEERTDRHCLSTEL